MTKKEILEFLIETMDIQIIDEYKTTDHKGYIQKCIEAKAWLLRQLHGKGDILDTLNCSADVDKYIKEKE